MLTFKEFLNEMAWFSTAPKNNIGMGKDVDVFKNPSRKELAQNQHNAETRIIIHKDTGDVYAFHPYHAIHQDIADHLTHFHGIYLDKQIHGVMDHHSKHVHLHSNMPGQKEYVANHPYFKKMGYTSKW